MIEYNKEEDKFHFGETESLPINFVLLSHINEKINTFFALTSVERDFIHSVFSQYKKHIVNELHKIKDV